MTDPLSANPPDAPEAETSAPTAGDAGKRLDRRARRRAAAALRDASFDWLADGFTHREIAEVRKTTVAEVRRDVARAIRARQAQTREGHAQLQMARLTKGLALVTREIEGGNLAAIAPLVKVVTALDRYHAAGASLRRNMPAKLRRADREALAAPPLALAHAPAAQAADAPTATDGPSFAVEGRGTAAASAPAPEGGEFAAWPLRL